MSVTGHVWSVSEIITAANLNTIKDDLLTLEAQGIGEESVYIPASAMVAEVANEPGALEKLDCGTLCHYGVPFDDTVAELLNFNLIMPKRYDKGSFVFRFAWTTKSGGASGSVIWGASVKTVDDGDALGIPGTIDNIEDVWQADLDVHISPWCTNSNGSYTATGDTIFMEVQIRRNPGHGSDNLVGDAYLLGVLVRWTSDQETDD